MAKLSNILVIGATGFLGKLFVEASIKSGHSTFALVRESSLSDPIKAKLVDNFKNLGVTVLYGDLADKESLIKAISFVDVVISAVTRPLILDQINIIEAIKETGNVKRFLPSEFGNDVDRTVAIEPTLSDFTTKAQIRRAIEAAEIPYTYVVTGCFASFFLPSLGQCHLRLKSPPRDKVEIYDDGNAKAIVNGEQDIVEYTLKAVDDPRAVNKILYIQPAKNIVSQNDMVALWERKIGTTLEKTFVSEEELLKNIQECSPPLNFVMGLVHTVLVKGDLNAYDIDPSVGVEASELYPEVQYTSVDEYYNQFV